MNKTQSLAKTIINCCLVMLFSACFILFCGCSFLNGDDTKSGSGSGGGGGSSDTINPSGGTSGNGGSSSSNENPNLQLSTAVPSSASSVVANYFNIAEGNKLTGLTNSGRSQTELTIPDSVEIICDSAFNGNTTITQVTLPSSLKAIGQNAFLGCTNLHHVNISDLGKYVNLLIKVSGEPTYNGADLYLNGTKVTSIDYSKYSMYDRSYAGGFYGCKSITSVKLASSNVVGIEERGFRNCINLQSVTDWDNIRYIRKTAFLGCSSLRGDLTLRSVEDIESKAFDGTIITSCTIPNNCTVASDAFPSGCTVTRV